MKPASNRVLSGIPLLIPFFGFLMVVSGALGLWFVQQPLSQPQELRSDASVEGGQVKVAALTNDSQDLKYVGQNIVVGLGLNTANTSLNQATVVFNIITDTTKEIELITPEISGVDVSTELESTEDGFLAEVNVTPLGSYFSTGFDQKFLEIHFTPESEGLFELNFDQEESVAVSFSSQEDVLDRIPVMKYNVIEEPDEETADIKSCNQTCSQNADCEAGYRCFELGDQSRCRLAVNPSSSSCDADDESEKSRCNQSCEADWNCQQGLSCYQGLCRNSKNLTSSSCAEPATLSGNTGSGNETEQPDVQNCNESCTSNNDCDINFRCYQGACRLAVNPSSSSCSASTEKTISERYEREAATGSAQATGSGETATGSAAANTQPESTPESTPDPTAFPEEETALDTLFSSINQSFRRLPVVVIGVGLVLLTLGGAVYLLLSRSKRPAAAPPPPQTPPTPAQPSPAPQLPPAAKPPGQAPQASQAQAGGTKPTPNPAQGNSMIDRLKNKGITPPSGS